MSDYSKTTNFTAKDALTSGDPNKVIKGSEHDVEFDNIATSSATKSNKVVAGTVNNVIKQSAAGDLTDSGYQFSELVGNVTVTTAEANILDGATVTTAELNTLDGVTSTAAELNILDGATLDVTELNYVDGVTSAIQTQIDNLSSGYLLGTNNLSEVSSPIVSRENLEIDKYPSWWEYLGSGEDGARTDSASATIAKGEYHFTDYTLDAGYTLGSTSSTDAHLIIRCTGTCTIAGTIDLNYDGASGGADGFGTVGTAGSDGSFGGAGGSGGNDGYNSGRGGHVYNTNTSISGGSSRTTITQDGAAGAAVSSNSRLENVLKHKGFISDSYSTGGGGGGGGTGTSVDDAGNGGDGGGVVIIIADTIDFQSGAVITAKGANGGSSTNNAGGGGGGGGSVILVAKNITNNGTITVTGGSGGSSGVGVTGGAGGTGYSAVVTLT